MELKTALQRHRLSLRALNDRERSTMDTLNKHEKFLADRYRNLMWCTHIIEATRKDTIPNHVTVRFANVACLNCTHRFQKTNWILQDNERRTFQVVKTDMLEKLVNLYCTFNIDAQSKSNRFEDRVNILTESDYSYS